MGRPSKPLITRETAAEAALELIDEEGLSALSLQGVARKLGVKAPSLYYHFKNKSELVSEVARIVLVERAPQTPKSRKNKDWKESMVNLCVLTRRSLLRHPNAAPLLLEVFPERILLPTYEHWLRRYEVPRDKLLLVSEGLEKLLFGSALLGAMCRAQGINAFPSDLDADEYPTLKDAIKANRLSEEKLFEETIRCYLSAF